MLAAVDSSVLVMGFTHDRIVEMVEMSQVVLQQSLAGVHRLGDRGYHIVKARAAIGTHSCT